MNGAPVTLPAVSLGDVLGRLQKVRRSGDSHVACCPAHADTEPSMSVSLGDDGRVLMHCHRGCSFDDIAAALDFAPAALMGSASASAEAHVATKPPSASYTYDDAEGNAAFRVERYYVKKGGEWRKQFAQKRADGRGGFTPGMTGVDLVPFQLPAVLAAARAGEPVYIVEGEKDALTLRAWGLVATCNPGGAGKWRPEFAPHFRGASVVILPDNDDTGRRHAADVAASLSAFAASVSTLELPGLPEKGDVTDWKRLGHDRAELEALAVLQTAEAAPEFETEFVRVPLVDLPEVPQEVLSSLPMLLRGLCGHYPAGAERSVALMSALSVLSGCMPNVRAAHYDRHDGYGLHLMFALVARSGGGKGILSQIERLVAGVDKTVRETAQAAAADWDDEKRFLSRGQRMEAPRPFPSAYLLPANASKTYLLNAVAAAGETACVVETEIDTLVGASEQEWGDFSDLIRKAFHHEPYRMGRMGAGEGDTLTIERPSLALALSGTWGQVERLFGKNVENGFFNRFGFFVSSAERGFRSQRPTRRTLARDAFLAKASGDVEGLYLDLQGRLSPLTVHLDDAGWDAVDAVLQPAYEHAQASWMSERLTPFVQRLGVMCVRVAGLLTVLRAWDHNLPVSRESNMWATPLDVRLALELTRVWYAHGYALLSHLTPRPERMDPLAGVPSACRALYEALPAEFKRADADEAGDALGSKKRTVKDHLQRLQEAGMLQRAGHTYRKVAPTEMVDLGDLNPHAPGDA